MFVYKSAANIISTFRLTVNGTNRGSLTSQTRYKALFLVRRLYHRRFRQNTAKQQKGQNCLSLSRAFASHHGKTSCESRKKSLSCFHNHRLQGGLGLFVNPFLHCLFIIVTYLFKTPVCVVVFHLVRFYSIHF